MFMLGATGAMPPLNRDDALGALRFVTKQSRNRARHAVAARAKYSPCVSDMKTIYDGVGVRISNANNRWHGRPHAMERRYYE